jgi:DNA-binding transcriptional ArsR family regulator
VTAAFDLSQPTISRHLRVLRDVGLVEAPGAVEPLRLALGATS